MAGHPPIPFVELLGFELEHMHQGQAQLRYVPKPEHLNSFGITHGGASMTLLDVVMAVAASSLAGEDYGCVTIEMKSSFMQPAYGPLIAQGQVLHRTRSMAYCEGKVIDAQGQLCTHATGTFKYVRRSATAAPA